MTHVPGKADRVSTFDMYMNSVPDRHINTIPKISSRSEQIEQWGVLATQLKDNQTTEGYNLDIRSAPIGFVVHVIYRVSDS